MPKSGATLIHLDLFHLHFLGDKSQYRKTLPPPPPGDQLVMVSIRQHLPARAVNVNSHGGPESLSVNYLVGELSLYSILFCSTFDSTSGGLQNLSFWRIRQYKFKPYPCEQSTNEVIGQEQAEEFHRYRLLIYVGLQNAK